MFCQPLCPLCSPSKGIKRAASGLNNLVHLRLRAVDMAVNSTDNGLTETDPIANID
jgi:hypothetical protein